jgi:glycosyltransferase involved in cell wall biosynthesis
MRLYTHATVLGLEIELLREPTNHMLNGVHHTQSMCPKSCRLLYVVGQLGLGGLERQLFSLLQTMNRQRYKPVVIVWNYREQDTYVQQIRGMDVPVLPIGDKLSGIGKLIAFRRLVSQFQPEVVHSYSFHTNLAAWWATLGSTALPIGSIRNNFLFDRWSSGRILGRACARFPHVQICNSVAAKKTAEDCKTIFKASSMYVVRNGLNLVYFRPRPFPKSVTLLAIGSLYRRKRWDRLIRIISALSSRGERFKVRHVGAGPLRGELEELSRRLGVEDLIEFLGPRNDIPGLLADSMLLLHVAEEEGCSNVVMEAMACGRPVVAMDAGDIPFLVDDGMTGFVVSREDEARFVDRVFQLLSDKDLCHRMGLAARVKAEKEFKLERLISETLEAYSSAGWKD